jgi:uncharacterized protein with HEPN domain
MWSVEKNLVDNLWHILSSLEKNEDYKYARLTNITFVKSKIKISLVVSEFLIIGPVNSCRKEWLRNTYQHAPREKIMQPQGSLKQGVW